MKILTDNTAEYWLSLDKKDYCMYNGHPRKKTSFFSVELQFAIKDNGTTTIEEWIENIKSWVEVPENTWNDYIEVNLLRCENNMFGKQKNEIIRRIVKRGNLKEGILEFKED